MEIISIMFLFFILPIFFLIYYIVPSRLKNFVILFCSLFIIFWSAPVLFAHIIFSTFLNFILCSYIYSSHSIKIKNICLFSAVSINLLIFIVCLFFDLNRFIFFEQNLISAAMIPLLALSNVSYILDVYTKKCMPQKNIMDYFTYIFMFPKLFLGPFTAYHKIESQLSQRSVNLEKISAGIELMIVGLAQKCILAGGVGEIQEFVLYQNISGISVFTAWFGAIAMFFSIYFNFAGYANMARGLGKMIGFDLPVNFRFPISANSVTNFFERWNISWLSFVKTYIGDWIKSSKIPFRILKIFLGSLIYAWFFGGSLNKFVAAIYFVLILILEKLVLFKIWKKISLLIRKFITFILILIGTVFISTGSLADSLTYLGVMFGFNGTFLDRSTAFLITSFISTLLMCWICSSNFFRSKLSKVQKKYDKICYSAKPVIMIVLFVVSSAFCLNN